MELIVPKDGRARPVQGRIKALERPVNGRITADLWPHPLTAEGRETRRVALRGGETLATLAAQEARRLGLEDAMIAAAVNGRAVPRETWTATPLEGGDIVTLRLTMRGGGGDSDPLRTVLQIALIVAAVAAPYLAPASWGTLTAAGAVSAKGALLSAGVMIGGSLVINAIAPPRLPDPPGAPGGSQGAPVYSVTGGASRARAYEPLLLVLGTHRVFPDLAAREYTEVVDEDHYLHQIFHFGLGDLEVSDLRIGDSPLDGFEEVTSQWADARGDLTLFPGNVDTEQGAALEDTDWIERTSAPGSVRIGIDLAGRLFQVNESTGDILRHAVHIEIEYWPGDDTGAKVTHAVTLEHGSTTPYRRTLSWDLPRPGVYTVRLRRAGPKSPDGDNHTDDIAWSALRSYQPDPADYAGQTRLALKIRASGQLTGRLDRLSAITRQKVPTWDGTRWTAPQASSNPAWIFRWYAKGVFIGGKLAAGAGLSDARIDDDALKAWCAWCAAQGLACDYVIDRAASHAEILTLIAQCGRASPTWASGKLGAVWNEAGKPATALITPGNIVQGSFEVDYASGKAAEEIACRYIDPDLDWQWNTVRRGDVVHVTHSLIDGGATGRLAGGTAERLQLDRPVTLSGAGDYLLLRLPDGSLHTSAAAHPDGGDGETDNIVLASPLPEAPDAGGASPLDTLWRLYAADTPPARARIVAIEPAAGGRVRIEAIDEADAYHAVEIAVSLTVAGDWRGGVIRAALDGGTPRTVARLVDGETEASWITAPVGTLIITAIPGTEAAPLGAPFTVTYEIQGKVLPPGPPANFLIDVLGDGTRRFRWTPPADADLAGVLIRHAETAPGLSWETMLPMHNGPLVASPWETNSPPAGSWSFAAPAIDTSGNISKAVWITGDLPDPRLGDTLVWKCPSAGDWPGGTSNAVRSSDGLNALEGEGAYTWDELTTWDAWTSWALGDGTQGAREMTYTAEPYDLGVALTFALSWDADVSAGAELQYRAGAGRAAVADAAWTGYRSGTTVTARWIQLRWRLTGDGTVLLHLDHLCWSVLAPTRTEVLRDANTASWSGSAAAGRRSPTALASVVDVDLVLQNVGAGWTWTLIGKSPPTIKIFDGAGAAADAVVDITLRGVAA